MLTAPDTDGRAIRPPVSGSRGGTSIGCASMTEEPTPALYHFRAAAPTARSSWSSTSQRHTTIRFPLIAHPAGSRHCRWAVMRAADVHPGKRTRIAWTSSGR